MPFPNLNPAAAAAYAAYVANRPADKAVALELLPGGVVVQQGGTLSPEALALAQQIRPAG